MPDIIHSTDNYDIRQPADGSFLIVPRTADAREVLAEILHENEFDLAHDPIRDDGSYQIHRDNPFGLVRTIDECEARMTIGETLRHAGSAPTGAGNTSPEPNGSAPGA